MIKTKLVVFLIFFSLRLTGQSIVKVTGKVWELNGVSEVPYGLFGVHAGNYQGLDSTAIVNNGIGSVRAIEVSPSGNVYQPGIGPIPNGTPKIIQCWFDRFVPARQVVNPNGWKADIKSKAANFASNSLSLINPPILEFWNEPYLNWAYKPGVNTDPQYFDSTGVIPGDSVKLKGTNYFQKSLIWGRGQWYRGNWAANTSGLYVAISQAWNAQLTARNIPYPGLNGALLTGEVYFPNTNRQFTVTEQLRPIDPTQSSFYSAKQGAIYYNEMLQAVLDTALVINPNLKVLGGWGFEVHKDKFRPFYDLFKPMLDAFGDKLYGVHEHHYGMDTRIIANDYQTLYAYNWLKHRKPLKFFNTETGGFVDPQRPNQVSGGASNLSNRMKAYQSYQYNAKDIIHLLAECPDKAEARAIHEPQLTAGGFEQLFSQLKSFRGKLIYSASNDPNIKVAACLTDTTIEIGYHVGNQTLGNNIQFIFIAPQGRTATSVTAFAVDSTGTGITQFNLSGDTIKIQTLSNHSLNRSFFWRVRLSPKTLPPATAQTFELFADKVLLNLEPNVSDSFNFEPIPSNFNVLDAELKLGLYDYGINPSVRLLFNGFPLQVSLNGGNTFQNTGGISTVKVPVNLLQSTNTVEILNVNDSLLVTFASLRVSSDSVFTTPLSVNRQIGISQLTVYPNPGKDQLQLTSESEGELIITDITGRPVLITKWMPNSDVPVNSLANGLYIIHLQTKKGVFNPVRWIKQ